MHSCMKTEKWDVPGMRGGGNKGEWWKGWIQHCKKFCKYHNVPPVK
jgi:hypothetical protein